MVSLSPIDEVLMTEPVDTLVITFFEHPCLTAHTTDGTIVLSIRALCGEALVLPTQGELPLMGGGDG